MKAYVITYLPDDPIVRKKRYQAHLLQVSWLRENNIDIIISQRNYKPDEFIDGCEYYEQPESTGLLKPAVARNQLLDIFYASGDDWGLFLDDDSMLDPRGNNIIPNMAIVPDKVGVFSPLNPGTPGVGAWKDWFKTDEPEDYWVFIGENLKGSMMFIRNIPEKLKFRENVLVGEDVMFGYDMLEMGYGSYWCKNIILKESNASGPAAQTWNETTFDRTEINKMFQKIVCDEYNLIKNKQGLQKKLLWTRNNVRNQFRIAKKQNTSLFSF